MIKIIESFYNIKAEKLKNFDLNNFYKLFLDGYDCPYVFKDKGEFIMKFDKDGLHVTEELNKEFEDYGLLRSTITSEEYEYYNYIKQLLSKSFETLSSSRDCQTILEILTATEKSSFLNDQLPYHVIDEYSRVLLLIMHKLKLKIDGNIRNNETRLYNYLINKTLTKAGTRTYKLNKDIEVSLEYERVFTDPNEKDCFSTVSTELLAVKSKIKLVNLKWNECAIFDNDELALATKRIGEPSKIIIMNVWLNNHRRYIIKFTPFK